ncbi:hypothetical protein LTR34_010894 [Exophiala xenobiotica]|uniref:Uncharacterized protein n=1 Tax=Vermiconidia calcicola TaxID=1690605 RepID=A0AAV9PU88_9PEZI|nr:hypothetical protein LTR34_010894 [Exophiala xenobiotica]KAK5527990.1 hypothetical protein LTR25_010789 [Vermiconidia calcicola]
MAATSMRTTHTQQSEASTSRYPATRQPTEYFFSGRIAISEITGDFDIVNWSLCPWEEPSFDDTPPYRRRLALPDPNSTRLWPAEDFAGLDGYSSSESEDRPADRSLVSKKKKAKAKAKAKEKAKEEAASSPLAQFRDEMKRLVSPKIPGRRKVEISIPEIQVNGEPIDVEVEQEQEQENAVKQPEPELSSPVREWVEKRSGQGKESKARARKTGNWSEMWKAL